jgi:hypothetical protein
MHGARLSEWQNVGIDRIRHEWDATQGTFGALADPEGNEFDVEMSADELDAAPAAEAVI